MNEILLVAMAVISAVFVTLAWWLDRERLYSVIIIFLVLISITGGKLVDFFGHATNTGNVFYAAIFLATYFLIERYGKREGYRAIVVGLVGVVFFIILARLTLALTGTDSTAGFSAALEAALAPAPRIACASLIAFACSQTLNVFLYTYIKSHMEFVGTWLRANTTNLFAQILDSVIFFTIAFWGVVGATGVLDVILTGLVIKIVFMAVASPLLYLNGVEEDSEQEYTSVTWR